MQLPGEGSPDRIRLRALPNLYACSPYHHHAPWEKRKSVDHVFYLHAPLPRPTSEVCPTLAALPPLLFFFSIWIYTDLNSIISSKFPVITFLLSGVPPTPPTNRPLPFLALITTTVAFPRRRLHPLVVHHRPTH